jgi:hypothetical protein
MRRVPASRPMAAGTVAWLRRGPTYPTQFPIATECNPEKMFFFRSRWSDIYCDYFARSGGLTAETQRPQRS